MKTHVSIILVASFVSAVYINTAHGQSSLLPEQSTLNDHFGESIAADGLWMVVGDPQDSSEAPLRGSVHIYRNTGTGWTLYQRLSPEVVPGTGLNIFYGSSVDLNGDWLLVGAPGDDEAGTNSGAVLVYQLDSESGLWTHFNKLFSSNPQVGDHFGTSVAIDAGSSLAIVGQLDDYDTGKLHPWLVIDVAGFDWIPLASFSNPSGATNTQFGLSLVLDNNTLIAGAPLEGNGRGSAWIMTFNGNLSEFVVDAELQPDVSVLSPYFGSAVDIAGPRAIIGSPRDGNGASNGGSAYLFSKQTGSWLFLDKFNGTATEAGDGFGSSVQIESSSVVVGAPNHENQTGEAYSFDVTGSTAVE
ncbi:MAG: FG-GAP repeat protein, partial [Phycisphaerales bacterium]|nr:FG-GAP repeat protein [Phycisphaerales bacterium]